MPPANNGINEPRMSYYSEPYSVDNNNSNHDKLSNPEILKEIQ
jgi:hypothetical protein